MPLSADYLILKAELEFRSNAHLLRIQQTMLEGWKDARAEALCIFHHCGVVRLGGAEDSKRIKRGRVSGKARVFDSNPD